MYTLKYTLIFLLLLCACYSKPKVDIRSVYITGCFEGSSSITKSLLKDKYDALIDLKIHNYCAALSLVSPSLNE